MVLYYFLWDFWKISKQLASSTAATATVVSSALINSQSLFHQDVPNKKTKSSSKSSQIFIFFLNKNLTELQLHHTPHSSNFMPKLRPLLLRLPVQTSGVEHETHRHPRFVEFAVLRSVQTTKRDLHQWVLSPNLPEKDSMYVL